MPRSRQPIFIARAGILDQVLLDGQSIFIARYTLGQVC